MVLGREAQGISRGLQICSSYYNHGTKIFQIKIWSVKLMLVTIVILKSGAMYCLRLYLYCVKSTGK